MIKANELRMGNWVGEHENATVGFIYQIECIDNYCKPWEVILSNGDITSTPFGIPLTEEWLLKFGFEKSTDSYGGYLIEIGQQERIRIRHNSVDWVWPLNGYHHPKVNFIHQLQNLYFALTGLELTIKE